MQLDVRYCRLPGGTGVADRDEPHVWKGPGQGRIVSRVPRKWPFQATGASTREVELFNYAETKFLGKHNHSCRRREYSTPTALRQGFEHRPTTFTRSPGQRVDDGNSRQGHEAQKGPP